MTCEWHARYERSYPLFMLLTSFGAQARIGTNNAS